MTVLLVLAFFVALISMDYLVTRRRVAREAQALAAAIPAVEPAWVAGYQMPEALSPVVRRALPRAIRAVLRHAKTWGRLAAETTRT